LDDSGQDQGRPLAAAAFQSGKLIGEELGDWAIWSVVEQSAKQIGIEHFGAHDLRRTCAKLCRKNGGTWNKSSFCLGIALFKRLNAILVPNTRSPLP
jgi:integrase